MLKSNLNGRVPNELQCKLSKNDMKRFYHDPSSSVASVVRDVVTVNECCPEGKIQDMKMTSSAFRLARSENVC